MKKILILTIACAVIFYLFYPVIAKSNTNPLLILEVPNQSKLPRHFRIEPSLQASGSGQFSAKGLQVLLQNIPSKKAHIVDLREESHGYLNGAEVAWHGEHGWANIGKTLSEIQADEKSRLSEALKQKLVLIYHHKRYPIPYFIETAQTESELAFNHEVPYSRIPVSDHLRPSDKQVDVFLELIKTLPSDTWLHFHCAAGEGRTTTFLVMYDIILNGHNTSLEEILTRQKEIGGIDLRPHSETHIEEWDYQAELDRYNFINKFFEYIQKNPLLQQKWSDWLFLTQS